LITRLAAHHRSALASLLKATPEFTPDEVEVALELIDLGLAPNGSPDYSFWVDEEAGDVRGYICFGPTPMTRGTFDLYWIAVARAQKGRGIGRALVARMEEELRSLGARLVRVETAGTSEYAETRAFYDRIGYEVVARIRDFYWEGNDLFIYGRYLGDLGGMGGGR
jgi:ribosomal protein S18 acetylase RimI-like enzyme